MISFGSFLKYSSECEHETRQDAPEKVYTHCVQILVYICSNYTTRIYEIFNGVRVAYIDFSFNKLFLAL